MTTSHLLQVPSANGDAIACAVALPATPGPAVVLIHEWWGLNDHIRKVAERLAAEGFVAFAPDLYRGQVATNAADASALMTALDWSRALADLDGTLTAAAAHASTHGKVGVMGFCMGGALTFAAAARFGARVGAAVPYYGIPPGYDPGTVTAPLMAHFAVRDGWAKPELAVACQTAVHAAGRSMELHVYDADHAFANDTRPEVYNPAAAALAWSRTVTFFRERLRG